jgi:hypothetical protein
VNASYRRCPVRCKGVGARLRACPQESFVFHGDSQLFALFTAAVIVAGRVAHDGAPGAFPARILRFGHSALRRSRPSWASRLRDAPSHHRARPAPAGFHLTRRRLNAMKPCKLPYTVPLT